MWSSGNTFRVAFCLGFLTVLVCYFYTSSIQLPPHMSGTSSFAFKPVVHAYKELVHKSVDLGSSLSVYHNQINVIDVVGGYLDTRFRLPWSQISVTQVFTLSMISIPFTFAKLVQNGLINLHDEIAHYLPQFRLSNITINDLLLHKVGFPYFSDQVSIMDWRDDYRSFLSKALNQVPPIKPNTQMFHFHTLSLISDAIVRRVDLKKRTVAHFFMEEIAWPLGLDLMIGIPRTQLYRAARTYHAKPIDTWKSLFYLDWNYLWINLLTSQSMPYSLDRSRALNLFDDYELLFNMNPDMMEIPLTSIHMFTNARSLSRLFTLLDPIDNESDVEDAIQTNTSTPLNVFTREIRQWMLNSSESSVMDPVLQRRLTLTQAGFMVEKSPKQYPIIGMWDDILGQVVFVDPQEHLIFAYTTNHAHGRSIHSDPILNTLINAVYKCLD